MSSSEVKPRERSANIFINYRREDTAGHAGRLFDALSRQFAGRLFMDVDTLAPGVDFVEAIEQAVGSCDALIVVIGRGWLTIKDKAGRRRLDDAGDFVRLEIESALARRIRIIPVLVQDAPMPQAEELPPSLARLARRNAIELSDARWSYDVERLARAVRDILQEKRELGTGTREPRPAIAGATPSAELRAEPRAESATLRQIPLVSARAPSSTIGSRAWLLSLGAAVLVAAVVLVSLAASGRGWWARDDRSPVPPDPKADEVATPPPAGESIGVSTSSTTGAGPSGPVLVDQAPPAAPSPSAQPEQPPAMHPVDVGLPDTVTHTVALEPAGKPEPAATAAATARPTPRIKLTPASTPVSTPVQMAAPAGTPRVHAAPAPTPVPSAVAITIPFDDVAVVPAASVAPPKAPTPAPSLRPARVTILSPQDCEVVDSDVLVRGVVSGLGAQQIFLGIRQANGSIYPRGEIFPDAEGVWSIKLRSSKEKTFDILVVATSNVEASRLLRDQKSRDDGLAVLPPGAVIGSGVVRLKRQGKLGGILHPSRANGDC